MLACMASVESCAKTLSTQHGVAELLVQYLHERPRGGATTVELSACERLQQKAAIAISRLCNSEDVGLIFIELHCECVFQVLSVFVSVCFSLKSAFKVDFVFFIALFKPFRITTEQI